MRQMLVEWIAVFVLGAALAVGLVITDATVRLDNVLYDAFVRRLERPAADDILIVAIDDASLQALGPWPWPRAVHARLLDRLADSGVKAVGYDVLFLEPAPDPADDAALARSLARTGRVCLPVMFDLPGPNGQAFATRAPPPELRRHARLGHVDMVFDADGLSRRAVLYEGDGVRRLPHLVECLRLAGTGAPPGRSPLPDGATAAAFVREGTMLIPFAAAGGFRTVSAASVIAGEVPDGFLRGKLVLVGATAAGLDDRHSTPLSTRGHSLPGVEIEANLLNARLSGDVVDAAGQPLRLAFTLAGVALMMLALAVLPPRRALPLGFGVIVAAVATSGLTLIVGQVWLPPFALILTVLVLFPVWGWRRLEAATGYMVAELQRFAAEPDLLRLRRYKPAGGDAVAQQIQLMHQTIARVRDLRRFAADTLRSLPDPTVVLNRDGEILFGNRAARRLARSAGFSRRRRRLADLAQGWTDLEGAPLRLPIGSAASGAAGWAQEVLSPEGQPYLAALAPHGDAAFAEAWILRLTDIGELKAAAAQREQIIQLLSHDMRAPQSSILALLETAPPEAVPPDLKQRLAGYARRTLALAGNFVQLARARSSALAFELVDLGDILVEAADELWPLARQAGVRIDVLSEGEHLIAGERDLLTRAFINLLDNAIKYSAAGTVVTCRLAESRNGAFLVTIVDQGVGMSAEQLGRLFTPFQRFASGSASDGTGLGLSLVAQVMARHGATIECRSAPGEGATFTLAFPPASAVSQAR
ncbi:CHASE2 domain-containing protein [Phenylobacterium sp. VNQ135]|uniref:CHASE2 domain-containing protein n=1 Tax=Phenylobacterium sp. VNQ135 TaxID=3400922 RepID=UPI003C02E377